MANNENLKPQNTRTKSEQRKIAQKGGKASGKARREKADFRKALQAALDGEYTNKNGETLSGSELLIASMMQIAGNPKNKGSAVSAFNTLIKMMGQDVPQQDRDDDDQVRAFLDAMRGESND